MKILTCDFESHYAQGYSLSSLTTEEYIRDPRFEVIGVAVKIDDGETEWASGSHAELKEWLKKFDWKNSAVLAHNAQFDCAILSWIFDIHPKFLLDTLSMSRALHGVEADHRLAALAVKYGIGTKGTEVIQAKGKRRGDFSEEELADYGDYCINDVELTYKLFRIFAGRFPAKEFKLIDLTLKMFTEPVLELNKSLLTQHLSHVVLQKQKLLESLTRDQSIQKYLADPANAPLPPPGIGIPTVDNSILLKNVLMSNDKLADILRALDVDPPMKFSVRKEAPTYAFAKSDEAFTALLEHEDPRVQAIVAARIGVKSTLEETRTERFIGIATRGKLPAPLKYFGAHTSRFSGLDSINLQNLSARDKNKKALKQAILAPKGYVIIDGDSSQIEARVTAWLAGQTDLVEGFRQGRPVYEEQAAKIYGKDVSAVTPDERFSGKVAILQAQYGSGAPKFMETMRQQGRVISLDESRQIIQVYRDSNPKITALWRQAQNALACMTRGEACRIGVVPGVIDVLHKSNEIQIPAGLTIKYTGLTAQPGEKGPEFFYRTRRSMVKLYGAKCVENLSQAVARCVVTEQMLKIAKRYRVVLTVHDSVVCCVREEEQEEAAKYITECMRWTPEWARGLPVNCEVKIGPNYGDTVKWTGK